MAAFMNDVESDRNFVEELNKTFNCDYKPEITWEEWLRLGNIRDKSFTKFQLFNYKIKIKWFNVTYKLCSLEKYKNNKNLLDKYSTWLNWHYICHNYELTEEDIENYKILFDNDCWSRISRYQKLSKNFIKKYKEKLNWKRLEYYQELDEDLIYENIDKLELTYDLFFKLSTYFESNALELLILNLWNNINNKTKNKILHSSFISNEFKIFFK